METPTGPTGYRRRILIEPVPGVVRAELEDDYHRMIVTLTHSDGIVTSVDSDMKRWPWTACPGAMEQLRQTFEGHPLAGFVGRGEKRRNCTHLHDLALLAASHAADSDPVSFEIFTTDPVDGVRQARLTRNGREVLSWTLEGSRFAAPLEMTGLTLETLNDWIAGQDEATKEAARLLRWGSIIAYGRGMDMPAHIPATRFPGGACFNFQPERAVESTRRPNADVDFSVGGRAPMADRSDMFATR